MVLMVMALGELAKDLHIGIAQTLSQRAERYVQAAIAMLPAAIIGGDITAVQCLILFWLCFIKPR